MNVEIGTEAAQFPEKEYINWIFVAVTLGLYQQTQKIFPSDLAIMKSPTSQK
jgi:hypothetical protein